MDTQSQQPDIVKYQEFVQKCIQDRDTNDFWLLFTTPAPHSAAKYAIEDTIYEMYPEWRNFMEKYNGLYNDIVNIVKNEGIGIKQNKQAQDLLLNAFEILANKLIEKGRNPRSLYRIL